VIEGRGLPGGGGVTEGARTGETAGHMVRIGWPLEIGLMTGVAVGGRTRESVAHMALAAGDREMGAGQRETRAVVVESGRAPSGAIMARLAIARIIARDVIRVGGLLIIRLMA